MAPHRSIPRSSSRSASPGVASTAGALVALVAVAALMTSATPIVRATPSSDARQSISEGAAVRAVAAAVVAAARDLVGGGERLVHALPDEWMLAPIVVSSSAVDQCATSEAPAVLSVLPESLLDLPPPVC
jgi:hypothetical protein